MAALLPLFSKATIIPKLQTFRAIYWFYTLQIQLHTTQEQLNAATAMA